MKDLLTIVIPSKDESMTLIKTLSSIDSDLRVIVTDCSTDDTRDLVRLYYPSVEIIDGGLPSVARNLGSKLVETQYVLFLDADMDISKLSLESLVLKMKRSNLLLSTCKITTSGKYAYIYDLFYPIQELISRFTPFAIGGFMLFNTEEFRRLGGFNNEDKFAEDYHLSMKVDPDRFHIFSERVYTSDRRFRNKSVWYMVRLMVLCWFNRKNDEFYKKDYNYWK